MNCLKAIQDFDRAFEQTVFTQNGSFFDHNETNLKSYQPDLEIRINRNRIPNWLFIVLILQLALVAYLRSSFMKNFQDLFDGLKNISIAQQIAREQELSLPFSSVLFNLNFVVTLGIYGFLLVNYFEIGTAQNQFQFFSLIALGLILLFYGRYLVLKLLGIVFPVSVEADDYSFNFFLVQKVIGLVIIPFNFLIAYAPNSLTRLFVLLSIFVVCALLILGILKGLVIGKNYYLRDKFHFFLYICTLEIAPILIIVKLLSSWMR